MWTDQSLIGTIMCSLPSARPYDFTTGQKPKPNLKGVQLLKAGHKCRKMTKLLTERDEADLKKDIRE
jgi:hypothetical protein